MQEDDMRVVVVVVGCDGMWVVIRGYLGCRLDAVIQWCRWWLPSASALSPN